MCFRYGDRIETPGKLSKFHRCGPGPLSDQEAIIRSVQHLFRMAKVRA